MNELILVIDYGGQYKELIAGSIRNLSVYSEIKPGSISIEEIRRLDPRGIILTGGPASVYGSDAPRSDPALFALGIPILGICYGMHLMCHTLGGAVEPSKTGEYGRILVTPDGSAFLGDAPFEALMSHRDAVCAVPDGFRVTASTADSIAAFEYPERKLYGVQFHPETKSTDGGIEILRRFLFDICGVAGDYHLEDYIETQIREIRETAGSEEVLLALSGGVDSSVCASLLSKAIPGQLTCIFVDHGFMRLNEGDDIERVFRQRDLRFIRVNAEERFLAKLKGVDDPETKRKLIGNEFIRVFEEEAKKLGDIAFLAQGTIYPDIVESGGKYGATIKSHHNVGGLPKNLSFKGLIEPLKGLFKDEVRALGRKLDLPDTLVNRQPFPGPGLAIRVMGDVTKEKLDTLRLADAIFREEIDRGESRPDQYFAVMTNSYSVGVKGDDRTYDPVIALRAVVTNDFMTAEYAELPHELLKTVAKRITGEIPAVSRVVYDISSKPPSTVEWE